MSLDTFAIDAITWLVTFAVHSTLLLGAAWLLASRLAKGAHRDEERWWKLALVAGLLTASGQTALGIRPLTGEFLLPAVETETASLVSEPALLETASSVLPPEGRLLERLARRAPGTSPGMTLGASLDPKPAGAVSARSWVVPAVGIWIAGASLGLLALALSWLRLGRVLRHRTRLSATDGGQRGDLYQVFDSLAQQSGLSGKVQLSASNRLGSPITLGIMRREICVPHAAVHSLQPDEQRAMLAHELAHAKRRDPAWLLAINVLERLLFFQPLLRIARRRQQHLAEYLCDDWAMKQTRDPVSLASCLTEVAGWVVGQRPCRLAPSMAAAGIELDFRVRRILARGPVSRAGRVRHALLPLAVASCIGVLFGIPSVTASSSSIESVPESESVETRATFKLVPNELLLELESAADEASPEGLLEMLDQEFRLLRDELESLRTQAATLDASQHVLDTLDLVEARLTFLTTRRERLAELLPQLSRNNRNGSPAARR